MPSPMPTASDTATALDDFDVMPGKPRRDEVRRNHRGRKTTIVHFRGNATHYPTARAAYIALIDHFIAENSTPLNDPQVTMGSRDRNYFAREKEQLYLRTPSLIETASNFHRLKSGWYAITNLSTTENFKILCRYANACDLQHGIDKDWDFEPLDPTDAMSDVRQREKLHQEMQEKIAHALDDLDAM
jgi:hypothetical protein